MFAPPGSYDWMEFSELLRHIPPFVLSFAFYFPSSFHFPFPFSYTFDNALDFGLDIIVLNSAKKPAVKESKTNPVGR